MIKKMSFETRRNVHPNDNIDKIIEELENSFHSQ